MEVNFFESIGNEIEAKKNRLTTLIGKEHWLSVGSYKECLIRDSLRRVLPKRFSVSTGFIIAADHKGVIVKSRQLDIVIWDNVEFSPLFQDGDFVIVPPEAAKLVIEIKSNLTNDELKKCLFASDSLQQFDCIPNSMGFRIRYFVFSFESRGKSIEKILERIAVYYNSETDLPISSRLANYNHNVRKSVCIDELFILDKGIIRSQLRGHKDSKSIFDIVYDSYCLPKNEMSLLYQYFERTVQLTLAEYTRGNHGYWSISQPGLSSLQPKLGFSLKSTVIIPPIKKESLHDDEEGKPFIRETFIDD